MPKPLNILYIHSHDTGRWAEPYGAAVQTPNLRRLAEAGVLFRRCHTASPTCTPSRACLLTGRSAHSHGLIGLAHRGFRLSDPRQHLVNHLKAHGYTGVLAGVQHVASGPDAWKSIGYDRFLGPPATAHETAAAFLAANPTEPFFLSVGFNETHREFPQDPAPYDPRYCVPAPAVPDTPETRLDRARFNASVTVLDRKMGTVFDALERSGLDRRTLVVCTTDHGPAFPRMKCTLHDGGTGVMLILKGPGEFGGGKVSDALVSNIDVFPTLCDAAGLPHPPGLEGKSLLPILRGDAEEVNEQIFSEVNFHAAAEPMRSVRTSRLLYIRRYDGRDRPVRPNCDDSPSKTAWLDAIGGRPCLEAEALYDCAADPGEYANLAGVPACEGMLNDMRARLAAWMERTNDPLARNGELPVPPGALLNDPDGISPKEAPRPART